MKKERKHQHYSDLRQEPSFLTYPAYSTPYSMVDNGCMNQDQFSGATAPVDANSGIDSGVAPGY